MRLAYNRVVVTVQGVPVVRYSVTDVTSGLEVASFPIREDARTFIRNQKLDYKARLQRTATL